MMYAAAPAFDTPAEEKNDSVWISMGITAGIVTLLLIALIFWRIVVPNPPLPPAPETTVLEFIDLGTGGSGENAISEGGSSLGESGEPGATAAEQPIPTPNPSPATNGAVTSDDPDNPPANTTPQPSNALKDALASFNKSKGKATISLTGGGQGNDPYGAGIGGVKGNGEGDGDGAKGTDGGGTGGTGGGDGRGRKLLSKPEVKNPTLEEGVVAVNIYVTPQGIVKRAEVNSARSTTINSVLRVTATQYAYKLTFSEDAKGPNLLLLTVEFNFTLK